MLLIIRFTWSNYFLSCSSYSEENFGGNQLLDSSISLSPLYPSRTSDLHVSTVVGPPSNFRSTSSRLSIVRYLSGPTDITNTRIHPKTSGSVRIACQQISLLTIILYQFAFVLPSGLIIKSRGLVMAMDSSVRVTRRVDTHHFVSITIKMGKMHP